MNQHAYLIEFGRIDSWIEKQRHNVTFHIGKRLPFLGRICVHITCNLSFLPPILLGIQPIQLISKNAVYT